MKINVSARRKLIYAGASALSLALAIPREGQAQVRHFQIPAQPANSAIMEFGRQAHVQILAPSDAVDRVTTQPLNGDMEVRAALDQLLRNTGLGVTSADGQTFILRKAPASIVTRPARAEAKASPVLLQLRASSLAGVSATPSVGPENALSEIVVTGSRVQRSGFSAPTPMTVQTLEALERQAFVNVIDLLNQVPAVHGSTGVGNIGLGTALYNNPATSFVNLRNLGAGNAGSAARTLTLVDGQRVVFESTGGAIDLNMIPTIMIERTEVVTGGASAAYGSDAVAGVVNMVFKKDVRGIQAETSYGISKYGDNKTYHAAFLGGAAIGSRGHFMFAAQYDDSAGVPPSPGNKRAWADAQYSSFVGAGNVRYFAADAQSAIQTYGGIISSGPLKGIAFLPDGTPYNFVYGERFGNPNATTMSGGSNKYNTNADSAPMIYPSRRFASIARYRHQLTDDLDVALTLNYAFNESNHPSVTARDPGGNGVAPVSFVIRNTNPFVPASVLALMTANNLTSITLGRTNRDIGPYQVRGSNQVYQGALDFKGGLSAFNSRWSWDAHAGYGSNRLAAAVTNMRIDARFQDALNAERGPNGVIQCASATARANGCIPFNPFGENRSPGANKYFQAQSSLWQVTERTDLNANLRGAPFSTWAGPVSVATGLEYRRDSIDADSDPMAQQGLFTGLNNKPLAGSISVFEGYAEAVVPLLSGQALAKDLSFDGAVREAHYDLSGNITTWKAGLIWQVNDDLRFRTSYSRDVRAPNVNELFTGEQPGTAQLNVILPGTTVPQQQLTTTITRGNLNLVPERAKTFSYGVGYQPSWLRGFRASVDYYNIKIGNAIATTTAQTIVTNCQSGQAAFCSSLSFGANNVARIILQPLNISALRTSGVDIDIAYAVPLTSISRRLPGSLTLNWLGNYVAHLITVNNGVVQDQAGVVGGGILSTGPSTPHWVWDANANYKIGRAAFNLHVHHVGGGVLDSTATPGQPNFGLLTRNHADSRTYYAVGLQYDIRRTEDGRSIQLYGNINNLFNLAPNNWGRDSSDVIGRFFTAGVRVKL